MESNFVERENTIKEIIREKYSQKRKFDEKLPWKYITRGNKIWKNIFHE